MGLVLVTGGTGFIGRRLVQRLRDGREVRVLSRELAPAHTPGVHVVLGDIRNATAVRQAVEGVETVFHLAGKAHRVSARHDGAEQRSITVEGTRTLLDAAAEASVRHFVFVSTLAVYGRPDSDGPHDESTPRRPDTPYGAAKRDAEDLVLEAGART